MAQMVQNKAEKEKNDPCYRPQGILLRKGSKTICCGRDLYMTWSGRKGSEVKARIWQAYRMKAPLFIQKQQ